MQLIDGRQLAADIAARTKARVAAFGFTPGLGVVLVGDDPASQLYVSLKQRAAAAAGIAFDLHALPATATQAEVEAAVAALNASGDVDGILLQLPLPAGLDADAAIARLDPAKDADGFHPENVARYKAGKPRVTPVLTGGIMALLAASGERLRDRYALVIGNSQAFYEPLAAALELADMTPSFCAPDDPALGEKVRNAGVIVAAAGRPGLVTCDNLLGGTIVVDVGTNRLADGRVVGDFDASACGAKAIVATPVPGGVGPVTVAMLLANVAELAAQRRGPKSA